MRRNLHRHRKLFQLVHLLKWRFNLVLEQQLLQHHQRNITLLVQYLQCIQLNMVGQHLNLMYMVNMLMIKHLMITYMTKLSSNNHLNNHSFLYHMKLMFMEIKQHL